MSRLAPRPWHEYVTVPARFDGAWRRRVTHAAG
jgi:hypothetical protein